MRASILNRKLHRSGALIAALPALVIIGAGLVLQLKKESHWIQPVTQRGRGTAPVIGFDRVLEVARLDVRPSRGMLKARCKNGWEVQIDTEAAEVLQVACRRSDLIESIHDGSFFHAKAKLWVFLPAGVLLFGLWITGVYLWLLPHLVKQR